MQTALKTSRISPALKYVFLLAAATLAGILAGALFWMADAPDIQHPDLWRVGSVVAGLVAAILAYNASRDCEVVPVVPRPRPIPIRREKLKSAPAQLPSEPATKKLGSAIERERDRLKSGGFTDAEISQILIARESNGHQSRGSLGTGTATGVLNNIDAVVTHARNLLPSFKGDIDRMLDPDASTGERTGSAVAFAVKMAALIAIGYFVYIEALQLRSMAYKSWAEACIERQKNAINFTPMNRLLSGNATRELDQECAP